LSNTKHKSAIHQIQKTKLAQLWKAQFSFCLYSNIKEAPKMFSALHPDQKTKIAQLFGKTFTYLISNILKITSI